MSGEAERRQHGRPVLTPLWRVSCQFLNCCPFLYILHEFFLRSVRIVRAWCTMVNDVTSPSVYWRPERDTVNAKIVVSVLLVSCVIVCSAFPPSPSKQGANQFVYTACWINCASPAVQGTSWTVSLVETRRTVCGTRGNIRREACVACYSTASVHLTSPTWTRFSSSVLVS